MNKGILTISIFLCVSLSGGYAQEYSQTPVSISKDKTRGTDGKLYYMHVVQERQTLFSVAKAYGVSVDEVCEANPLVNLRKDGLKKNSIILIPVGGKTLSEKEQLAQSHEGSEGAEAKSAAQTAEVSEGADKVKAKSTKVSDNADKAAEASEAVVTPASQQDGLVKIHVVKWYEDIDDIARLYGVSAEEILKYNGIKRRKVKSRTKLMIPPSKAAKTEEKPEEQPSVEPTEQPKPEEEAFDWNQAAAPVHEVKALMMMPLSGTDQGSMDFYSGVLLALKDLKTEGISADLSVYDVSNGAIPVSAEKIASSDLVIGPVSPEGLGKVLSLCPEDTPIVSPLDPKVAAMTETYKSLIQAPTPPQAQYHDLARWLKKDKAWEDKVILLTEKGAQSTTAQSLAISNLNEEGISYSSYSYGILEGRNAVNGLSALMTASGCNRVLIASDNEAFVYDALRNLGLLVQKKFNVVLYAGAKIRSYETIEAESLHELNLHASLSYNIDYSAPKVKSFVLAYRALFGTEPTQFAFQGYDVAYYFIGTCGRWGKRWVKHLARRDGEKLLQSDFLFYATQDGGFINQGVRRVIYDPDFSIKAL